MAFSRRLGVVGILGACWFVAVGCGDDEDRKTGIEDGGEGGEGTGTSGSGGKSSIAGSQNNAGKGGTTAGSGGAGDAGAVSGGVGGVGESGSGAGGEAGGGIVAGAGGDPGGGGVGGEGGAPPVPQAKRCDYGCTIDADCVIGADDTSHKCDPTSKRCRVPKMCDVNDDCVPNGSFWFATCDNDAGCIPDSEHCVTWQGVGYCASIPDPNFPEFPCVFGAPAMLPLFGAQGDVEVCVSKSQRCTRDGACEPGCGEFGCEGGDGDTCNPTTGLCECTLNTECTTGTSVCGAESRCECAGNTDCEQTSAQTGLDTCVAGTCGCAGPTTCPASPFANATAVCE